MPTTVKEVRALGWDYIDVILFTGDAYIEGAEHDIDEGEEETEHTPMQEFASGSVDVVR